MKKYLFLSLVVILAVMAIAVFLIFKPQTTTLPEGTKDCGSEENVYGKGYDPAIRKCFFESFKVCEPAKIYQNIYTIEGDPIMTTAIIEGKKDGRCKVHVYIDSRDKFGFYGKYDTLCYTVNLDKRNERIYLIINDCKNDKQSYI